MDFLAYKLLYLVRRFYLRAKMHTGSSSVHYETGEREGKDVTVVALAWMVPEALAAADELERDGISVEVVDPRTLVPMELAHIGDQ